MFASSWVWLGTVACFLSRCQLEKKFPGLTIPLHFTYHVNEITCTYTQFRIQIKNKIHDACGVNVI